MLVFEIFFAERWSGIFKLKLKNRPVFPNLFKEFIPYFSPSLYVKHPIQQLLIIFVKVSSYFAWLCWVIMLITNVVVKEFPVLNMNDFRHTFQHYFCVRSRVKNDTIRFILIYLAYNLYIITSVVDTSLFAIKV